MLKKLSLVRCLETCLVAYLGVGLLATTALTVVGLVDLIGR